MELKKGLQAPVGQYYDWQSRDFYTIATRTGEPFMPADKNREKGIDLVNVLFKTGMLKIYDDECDLNKLVVELENLKTTTKKSNAKDDYCDALRFAISQIPWNYQFLEEAKQNKQNKEDDSEVKMSQREKDFEKQEAKRKAEWENRFNDPMVDMEIEEANELYYGNFNDGGYYY